VPEPGVRGSRARSGVSLGTRRIVGASRFSRIGSAVVAEVMARFISASASVICAAHAPSESSAARSRSLHRCIRSSSSDDFVESSTPRVRIGREGTSESPCGPRFGGMNPARCSTCPSICRCPTISCIMADLLGTSIDLHALLS